VLAHPEGPWTWHLVDEALSTSGQSSLTLPGRQGSHLIDPRSLAPVAHGTEQVVVRGADGLTCDLWSTALLVLGRAAGERLLSGPTPPAGVTCALVYELPEPGEEPRPVLLEPQLR
jgi:thiamine biosynthesis lipoprotein ApbE